jgi:hypothetical protein
MIRIFVIHSYRKEEKKRKNDEEVKWADGIKKINYLMMILTNALGEDYHLIFQASTKKKEI